MAVSRWSGGSCKENDTPTRRSSTGEDEGLTFDDVSGLFLVVTAVILLSVVIAVLLFVVRCRQLRSSNDHQASPAVA